MAQNKEASIYFRQGLQLLHADRLDDALNFFTRAIGFDPDYAEAYRNRSEVLHMLGRIAEADSDQRKAELLQAGTKERAPRKVSRTVAKYDMKSVHSVYDDLLASGPVEGEDVLDFEDQMYDLVFSSDTLESSSLLASQAVAREEQADFPAILEYLDGRREEVLITRLFGDAKDKIVLTQMGERGEKIISLELLSCIRLSRVPASLSRRKDTSCHVEIIETIDGSIYHESIHSEQILKNVLYGFSTKQESRFKYTLIPRVNIRKRYQRRQLGQILLDKKLIAGDVLQHALAEHSELKKIKFGKVIAQHANILYSAVEAEIQRAYQANPERLKIGEILLKAGLVNEEQILAALEHQERLKSKKLGQFLVEKGILQERDIYLALAEKFRIPLVDLRRQKVTMEVLSLLPRELIQRLHVLPLALRKNVLVVATLMPDPGPICELVHKYSSAKNVVFVLVQPSHLKNVIRVLFPQKG